MPPPPSPLESTRLENLSVDRQGAAFDLAGRPVRLAGEGYASPVASMREFYQLALADYYQRSAELSRQAAAQRPPLLRRMLSWVGRIFDRLAPGPRAETPPGGMSPLLLPAPPPPPSPSVRAGREASPGPEGNSRPAIVPPEAGRTPPPDGKVRGGAPPMLHVVFADQNGVHVIWHLPSAKHPGPSPDRRPIDPKAGPPRLELTYGLDSAMAQRLQDCYGQLAQLGYKIAGLDAVRVIPEKPAGAKVAAKAEAAVVSPGPSPAAADKRAGEAAPVAASPPLARRPRAKPEPSPALTEPIKPNVEPPNPSFLPGI